MNYSRWTWIVVGALVNAAVLTGVVSLFGSRPVVSGWIILALASVACGAEVALAPTKPREVEQVWESRLQVLTGCLLFCILVAAISRAADGPWMAVGGLAMLAGIGLRGASLAALGAGFTSPSAAGTELITRGVYGRVRHPSETGLLLIALGAGIAGTSLVAVALWIVVLLPVTMARLRIEERALRSGFGRAYDRYAATVPRLLPEVY